MTIHPVEFVHASGVGTTRVNKVRLRGTDQLVRFNLVAEGERSQLSFEPGARLIGWLGINLVVAEPRDIEGSKFDLIGIAASGTSDP